MFANIWSRRYQRQATSRKRLQLFLGLGLATFSAGIVSIPAGDVVQLAFFFLATAFVIYLLYAYWVGRRELGEYDKRNTEPLVRRNKVRRTALGIDIYGEE